MKPFRKNVAIAIDGGGIRGTIPARALAVLEKHLGKTCPELFRLTAGTSTGSIISAGIASGLSAEAIHALYLQLGQTIFRKTWRTYLWPLTRYRYPSEPLADALRAQIGDRVMGDFWTGNPKTDVVITAFDLVKRKTCFIKPYKPEYRKWPVLTAVLASSTVPTYFPVVEGRYVDGGVGSYANPCYLAAYELLFCLKWKPEETTLISLGTGRDPQHVKPGEPARWSTLDWLFPMLDAFMASAADQQVHLVDTFFKKLDFRRFQVDLTDPIPMDDASRMDEMTAYGEKMGQMIIKDKVDGSLGVIPHLPPAKKSLPKAK